MQKLTNTEYIVQFFLNLFRLQLGGVASDGDSAEAIPVNSNEVSQSYTYELRVRRYGDWKSRRMTIGPIGGNVESRSMCYKVVYDDVLVVKIPPYQISSFSKYLESINRERRILQRLIPSIRCVSPSISALLKRIPRFYDKKKLPPEKLEKEYIRTLRNNKNYQSHLKIGNTFVFFMELSEYPFLCDIIEKMHNVASKVRDEILENTVVLRDLNEFEAIYGSGMPTVFLGMYDAYNEYEKGISQLADQYEIVDLAPDYQMQQWFMCGLAEKELASEPGSFSREFIDDSNRLLKEVLKEKSEHIEAFRKATIAYVSRQNFISNRQNYQELIYDILDLIYRLREQGVAIRDLKPDNIFVQRNPEGPTLSVDSSKDFPLGLIDLETSVILAEMQNRGSQQQPLAGTPCYATPSHLFENKLLNQIFDDLPRIMFLQDLYAATGIVYNVVTGRVLFQKTGKLLPEIIYARKRAEAKGQDLAEVFRGCSRVFWKCAANEFGEIDEKDRGLLESLKVTFNNTVSEMLKHEALKENTMLSDTLKTRVSSQEILRKEKALQHLMRSSSGEIGSLKMNWKRGRSAPERSSAADEEVFQFLQDLEQLKKRIEINRSIVDILNGDKKTMSALELLQLLFGVVLSSMSKEE